jgi:hypothetical protein
MACTAQVPSSRSRAHHEWASHVLQLLQVSTPSADDSSVQMYKPAHASHAVRSHSPRRVRHSHARTPAVKRAHRSDATSDAFGMPELVWQGEGKGFSTGTTRGVDLKSGRGCGSVCQKQAQMLADNMLPTN